MSTGDSTGPVPGFSIIPAPPFRVNFLRPHTRANEGRVRGYGERLGLPRRGQTDQPGATPREEKDPDEPSPEGAAQALIPIGKSELLFVFDLGLRADGRGSNGPETLE